MRKAVAAPALPRRRVSPGTYLWRRLAGDHWLRSAVWQVRPEDLPEARAGPRRAGGAA
ncbi:MAG: hypothetical protein DIU70_006420 [Bacillota bacterium]